MVSTYDTYYMPHQIWKKYCMKSGMMSCHKDLIVFFVGIFKLSQNHVNCPQKIKSIIIYAFSALCTSIISSKSSLLRQATRVFKSEC